MLSWHPPSGASISMANMDCEDQTMNFNGFNMFNVTCTLPHLTTEARKLRCVNGIGIVPRCSKSNYTASTSYTSADWTPNTSNPFKCDKT